MFFAADICSARVPLLWLGIEWHRHTPVLTSYRATLLGESTMEWQPISRESLSELIVEQLADATPQQRALFDRTAMTPAKWQLSPWGDPGGGFWVIAVMENRVLWYNDIEGGFNVSRFTTTGTIPSTEYRCNQDELQWALTALEGQPQVNLGPPEPLS